MAGRTQSGCSSGCTTPPVHELSSLSLTTDPSCASSTGTSSSSQALMMQLRTVKGLTGRGTLAFNALTDEVALAAGALVVAMPAAAGGSCQQPQRQRVFAGHAAAVACLALGGQGSLLATGQEGKQPVIRLWDWRSGACLAVLCAHASSLVALDVSADGRALIACGSDAQGRQVVVLWGISQCGVHEQQAGQLQVQLLVRHTSSHDVRALRLSPLEPDQFVTVGRESIRCYRMLRGEVRGSSVRLPSGAVAGGASPAVVSGSSPRVFTHVAFDAAASGLQLPTRHMFVAAASGAVFQVDLGRRAVTAVYELHPGGSPISALVVGEGLALTACGDGTLRLWPLDFAAPLLEAVHDAPITAACLAGSDGLTLLTAGEDGCLGRLDVLAQTHACLLRSHRAVVSITAHPTRPLFATVAADGSVRVWDAGSHEQLHEVCSGHLKQTAPAAGRATCAAFNPCPAAGDGCSSLELAVGTDDGCVRVLDAATGRVLQERRQHDGRVAQLVFTPDGARLLSCGAADGRVVAYAVRQGCLPIKVLTATTSLSAPAVSSGAAAVCAAASPDGTLLAVGQLAGSDGAWLLLCAAASLEVVLRVELANVRGISQLAFDGGGGSSPRRLWVLVQAGDVGTKGGAGSCSSSLLCLDAASGQLLPQLDRPHGDAACTAFSTDGHVLVTCGSQDGLIKLWPQSAGVSSAGPAGQHQKQPAVACQSFSAHLGAVTAAALLPGSWPQLVSGAWTAPSASGSCWLGRLQQDVAPRRSSWRPRARWAELCVCGAITSRSTAVHCDRSLTRPKRQQDTQQLRHP